MPPVSEAQRRLMHAAASRKGGVGGVSQFVGKEFAASDHGGKLPPRAGKSMSNTLYGRSGYYRGGVVKAPKGVSLGFAAGGQVTPGSTLPATTESGSDAMLGEPDGAMPATAAAGTPTSPIPPATQPVTGYAEGGKVEKTRMMSPGSPAGGAGSWGTDRARNSQRWIGSNMAFAS